MPHDAGDSRKPEAFRLQSCVFSDALEAARPSGWLPPILQNAESHERPAACDDHLKSGSDESS